MREWIIPGILPSTLRAVLRTFKFVPDEFVKPPTPTMSRWCSNQLSYATINQARDYTE